jgi:thiol-disulfide isomerase/thioredoxin
MSKPFKYYHFYFLGAVVLTVIAAWVPIVDFSSTHSTKSNLSYMLSRGELSWLKGANAWLNSTPRTASDLKGKVVLVQFGTYTCINWIRTLPYIRAWAEKYKDKGLVVIAVHTPEFSFEKNIENVRWATKARKIDFPIAIDNKMEIWNAFNNQYWPALYFIDSKGIIRSSQFGEGEYEKSERIIQQLLSEAGMPDIKNELVSVNPEGAEVSADWKNLKSPENYLGYERTENFAADNMIYDEQCSYKATSDLRLNHWSVFGEWTAKKELILLNKSNGRIAYRFQARDLHLVMGPTQGKTSIRFRVLINRHPPGALHGIDVDEMGNGTVNEQRLYQLIRQPDSVSDLRVEIEFLDPGIEAFAFTFG